MPDDHRLISIEGFAGDVTPESYGSSDLDVTHLTIPVAIEAPTTGVAIARANTAATVAMKALEELPWVRWIGTPIEATYALMANLATALDQMPEKDRETVAGASPVTDALRRRLNGLDVPPDLETMSLRDLLDELRGVLHGRRLDAEAFGHGAQIARVLAALLAEGASTFAAAGPSFSVGDDDVDESPEGRRARGLDPIRPAPDVPTDRDGLAAGGF